MGESISQRRKLLRLLAGGAIGGIAGTARALPAPAGGPPAVIGVVTYRIGADGTLEGVWTIEAYNGRLGRERASGGTPGRLAGSYDVVIDDPDARQIFAGTLTIAAEGEAWRMTWTGADGRRYDGLGLRQGEAALAAAYWGPVR
jgi:hypothetical protein